MGTLGRLPATFALAAVLAAPVLAAAGDRRDVTVENRTGEAIQSLFVSPVSVDDWEDDVPGVDVLADGESVDISFSGYEADQCRFDVLARSEGGDSWLLTDLDLCAVETITITAKYIQAR